MLEGARWREGRGPRSAALSAAGDYLPLGTSSDSGVYEQLPLRSDTGGVFFWRLLDHLPLAITTVLVRH